MQKARSIVGIALTIMLTMIAQPRCVWACDCSVPAFSDASNGAVAIFAGRVENIRDRPSINAVAVTFSPSTVWKGTLPPTVVVLTSPHGPSCGYEFQERQEYLVYARPAGTTILYAGPTTGLEASSCGRTQPLADATADLAALGDGQAPATDMAETPQPPVLPNTSGQIEPPALLSARTRRGRRTRRSGRGIDGLHHAQANRLIRTICATQNPPFSPGKFPQFRSTAPRTTWCCVMRRSARRSRSDLALRTWRCRCNAH